MKRYKEETNVNIRTEKYNSLKNSLDKPSSRREMTEERFSELKDRWTEIIQYEWQREKVNRASGTCGTIPKGQTFMSLRC